MQQEPAPEPEPVLPIHVVIVTGLPGAGRTAQLRKLLATLPPSAAPAVCVHHFAKGFGLETSPPLPQPHLLVPNEGSSATAVAHDTVAHYSEVYDFGSGCICCSPDGDLVRVLRELLLGDQGAAATRRPTHLLIETTGLADPAPFVRVFAQAEFAAAFALVGVVAVLSSPDIYRQLLATDDASEDEDDAEAQRRRALQLEVADVVVLSKADLLPELPGGIVEGMPVVIAEAERLIAAHCQTATKLHTVAAPGESPMLDASAAAAGAGSGMSWAALEALLPETGVAMACATACSETCSDAAGGMDAFGSGFSMPQLNWGSGGHDSSFCTAVCVEDGAVLWPQAEIWLRSLMESGRVLRLQGYLAVNTESAAVCGHAGPESAVQIRLVHGVRGEPLRTRTITLPSRPDPIAAITGTAAGGCFEAMGLAEVTAAREPLCCKLFAASAPTSDAGDLRESELGAGLRSVMAPQGYVLIGDLTLDFPPALEYLTGGGEKSTMAMVAQVDLGGGREATVNWTGQEFECSLGPGDPACVRVVGTKLYASVGGK